MFVKETKSKNYTYIQLVESYRQGNTTRHKVVANLGRLDQLMADNTLQTIGSKLLAIAKSPLVDLENVIELRRLCYGHIVYEKLWNKLDMRKIFSGLLKDVSGSTFQFDLCDTVFYTVVHKLLRSGSKRSACQDKDAFLNMGQDVKLHNIYRSLDFLADHKEALEKALFKRQSDLFNMQVDVAFYDVTTFHFESNMADELRDFGFSKNGKLNEVQVVLGLFTDQQGRPIGYELFEGNTFDGETMVKALKILKDRFDIRQVIIVADKGLNSKKNFHLIREAGYEYIVSARMKNLPKKYTEQIFDSQGYKVTHTNTESGEVSFQYKTIDYQVKTKIEDEVREWTDRLLITWSRKRARKNWHDRQRQIEKAERLVEKRADLKNKKGAKRYVQTSGQNDSLKAEQLNTDRIEKDAKWDGYYAIQYSHKELSHDQVLDAYAHLWRIEESFRVMKSTLQTRPVFHWKEKRIKGHFVMCFIAFMLERQLELKLKEKGISLSPDQIQKSLNELQVSELQHGENKFLLKGTNGQYGAKILRALNIRPLKNIQRI